MPALCEYGRVVRDDSVWEALAPQDYTHALGVQAYRGAAVSSATTYQLERVREETWPYFPAQMVGASPAKKLMVAEKMVEHFKHLSCFLTSFWEAYGQLYPTVRDILGHRLGGQH